MAVVLSRQIVLTPEQKATAVEKLREAFAEYQRQKAAAGKGAAAPAPRRTPDAASEKENVMRRAGAVLGSVAALVAVGLLAAHCAPNAPKGVKKAAGAVSDMAVAAQKTYIAPGDLDEYYLFSSGGHSGQIYVYGVPSMRHLSTIPVFTPYPATGYGFDDETRAMLGGLTWATFIIRPCPRPRVTTTAAGSS